MTDKKTDVTICLGSSCFSRGNNKNLEIIQKYFQDNNLTDCVNFKGHLCEDVCKKGPALKINETIYYGVTPDIVMSILNANFKTEKAVSL